MKWGRGWRRRGFCSVGEVGLRDHVRNLSEERESLFWGAKIGASQVGGVQRPFFTRSLTASFLYVF